MNKLIYTEAELPQKSDLWLEQRKNRMGGSDVAAALGVMLKYEKPITAWKRKTDRLKPKKYTSAMEKGNLLEEEARQAVLEHYKTVEGIKNPKSEPMFAIHPEYDEIAVSFDGVDLENKFITELKCPNFVTVFKSVWENGIQEYYYPQVQLQLAVANAHWGITKAYFCSYYPDGAYILNTQNFTEYLKTLAVIDIDYDPNYFNAMLKVIKLFNHNVKYNCWDVVEYNEALERFREETCNQNL